MKYMLFVCTEPNVPPQPDGPDDVDIDTWVNDLDSRGVRLIGEVLAPTSEATTVRVRDGQVLLTDGPFAETREQIVGFDIIECDDLDEALEVARRHPMARGGMIEVRPFASL